MKVFRPGMLGEPLAQRIVPAGANVRITHPVDYYEVPRPVVKRGSDVRKPRRQKRRS